MKNEISEKVAKTIKGDDSLMKICQKYLNNVYD